MRHRAPMGCTLAVMWLAILGSHTGVYAGVVVPPAPVNDPKGKCQDGTACDTVAQDCTEGSCTPWESMRCLSFFLPDAGEEVAVRVHMASLHHPDPLPVGGPTPSFSHFEGQDRYVTAFDGAVSLCCDPASDPYVADPALTECDSDDDCASLAPYTSCKKDLCEDVRFRRTYYHCAQLSCEPDYRDWSGVDGLLWVYGDLIIPDSQYQVAQLPTVCFGKEPGCSAASDEILVGTSRWGELDGIGNVTVFDLAASLDKLKAITGSVVEPRGMTAPHLPDPVLHTVSSIQCAHVVDALKGYQYPFHLNCAKFGGEVDICGQCQPE